MSTLQPDKTRDEGQWALGNRVPLNDTEQMQRDGAPLNVRGRIENVNAKPGLDSIDKSVADTDLRSRRWQGRAKTECGLHLS